MDKFDEIRKRHAADRCRHPDLAPNVTWEDRQWLIERVEQLMGALRTEASGLLEVTERMRAVDKRLSNLADPTKH